MSAYRLYQRRPSYLELRAYTSDDAGLEPLHHPPGHEPSEGDMIVRHNGNDKMLSLMSALQFELECYPLPVDEDAEE